MNKELPKTTAYYQDAIDALRHYIAAENDEENCEVAAAKIREYRLKIIDINFDEIAHRTKRLRSLMHELQAVIDNAGGDSSVGKAITKLSTVVSQVTAAVKGST